MSALLSIRPRSIACGALALCVAACDGPAPPFCGGNITDACAKARDLATLVGVQLGDESVAEGNAILGQSGSLNDAGKTEMSFRAQVMMRKSPRFGGVTTRTDATEGYSRFDVDQGAAMALSADFAVGVSRGTRVGQTHVAGLDFLGGLALSPQLDGGSLRTKNHLLGFSFGARLGILKETPTLPAVSLTGMVRRLPEFSAKTEPLSTNGGGTVSLAVSNGRMHANGWRLAALKQLGRYGIRAGWDGRTIT